METSLGSVQPHRSGEELLVFPPAELRVPLAPRQLFCSSWEHIPSVISDKIKRKLNQEPASEPGLLWALVLFPLFIPPLLFWVLLASLCAFLTLHKRCQGLGSVLLRFYFIPCSSSPPAIACHVLICFSWHPTHISLLLSADLLPLDRRWIVCTLYS